MGESYFLAKEERTELEARSFFFHFYAQYHDKWSTGALIRSLFLNRDNAQEDPQARALLIFLPFPLDQH